MDFFLQGKDEYKTPMCAPHSTKIDYSTYYVPPYILENTWKDRQYCSKVNMITMVNKPSKKNGTANIFRNNVPRVVWTYQKEISVNRTNSPFPF